MAEKTITQVTISENGPLGFKGQLSINGEDTTEAWLCRCGLSKGKPNCDGSHTGNFSDPGSVAQSDGSDDGGGTVKVTTMKDGPIITNGVLAIVDSQGELKSVVKKAAFCRCGASQNKPFCDGAHTKVQFSAD